MLSTYLCRHLGFLVNSMKSVGISISGFVETQSLGLIYVPRILSLQQNKKYRVAQKNFRILNFLPFRLQTSLVQPIYSPFAMKDFHSPNLGGTFMLYSLDINQTLFIQCQQEVMHSDSGKGGRICAQGPIKEGSTGSAQRGKRSEYRTFVHAYDIGAEHKSTQLNAEEILMSKSHYL